MIKVGIIGNGKLGTILAEAIRSGKAPECELVGIASRTLGVTAADLIAQGAQILLEATKPEALKQQLIPILETGVSVIPLSTGVFSDPEFTELVRSTAREHGSRVILPHGAEGAFDLAATYSLGKEGKGTVVQYLPPVSQRKGPFAAMPETFHGTALEGFTLSPAHLNVVMETAIACGGLDRTFYEIRIAEDGKSGFALELENEYGKATLTMEGKPVPGSMFTMIAWSAISTLNRITSPICF